MTVKKILACLVSLTAVSYINAQQPQAGRRNFDSDSSATDTAKVQLDVLLKDMDSVRQDYPVLYQRRKKENLVESTGYLQGSKLEATPSTFLNAGLTGRLAGLYTSQSSGEPGSDGVTLSLRGRQPLVLIDGVPRALWSINPEQIESVTLLKDALSTALLGMQSMNGAVLITTKKGAQRPGFNMNLKAQTGIAAPLRLPRPLGAYQYAQLYNEALANDGRGPLYTQADLEAYKNHSDPYGHPDINWYDQVLEKSTPFSRYTLNAEGTNKVVRYFVSLDYLNQSGLFKQSPANTYSTNTEYQRYTFRSNVDVNLTDKLSLYLNLFGRMRTQNEPGSGTANIFSSLVQTPDNAYPIHNPSGTLGGNINYSDNIYGQTVQTGYTSTVFSEGYVDLGVKYNLDEILDGWWVKGLLSYVLTLNQNIDRSKAFETFQMLLGAGGDTTYQRFGTRTDQKNASSVDTRAHQVYTQLSTGYSHQWQGNTLDAMLLFSTQGNTTDADLSNTYRTFGANIQYGIKGKYILQAAASYSGNNRYQPGYLYGFFPAGGIGWRVDKENFFPKAGFVNLLKLRASYGLSGNAVAGYYDYIDRYVSGDGYYFGQSAAQQGGLVEYLSPYVTTYAKGLKLDIGMDIAFANNRGTFSLDYYRNRLTDLVQARGTSSAVLGYGSDIQENLGKNRYSGLEMTLGWQDKAGSFSYWMNGNFSLSSSEILYNDEPDYPYSWMQHTGHTDNAIYGYVADGFITQRGEGPVVEGYSSRPGDIRYVDLNNDGVVNQYDKKVIGNDKPLLFYGADIGISWKNFRLSMLWQGVANHDIINSGNSWWAFQNDGKGQAWEHNLNRWTAENAGSATYPRVSVGTNVNNDVASSFWVHSGAYLRLKNAELSYTFDHLHIKHFSLHDIKVFINGLNLLTFTSYKDADPETLNSSYPIQRIFNGGLSIDF